MDNIARLLIGKYNIQHFRFISFHKCEITIYFIRCYYNTGLSCVSNACACQSGYYWASSLSRCRMAYLFRSFSFKIFPLKLINFNSRSISNLRPIMLELSMRSKRWPHLSIIGKRMHLPDLPVGVYLRLSNEQILEGLDLC
jgi:hypothetical protein